MKLRLAEKHDNSSIQWERKKSMIKSHRRVASAAESRVACNWTQMYPDWHANFDASQRRQLVEVYLHFFRVTQNDGCGMERATLEKRERCFGTKKSYIAADSDANSNPNTKQALYDVIFRRQPLKQRMNR